MIQVSGLSDKTYVENPAAVLALLVCCPLCREHGVEWPLTKDGRYPRRIPVGLGLVWSWIYRRYCRRCDTSFSLFPSFMLRRMAYGRSLVLSWLWASLQGVSCRDQAFFKKHGILCASPDELTSWSDLLDIERTRPGYQLLWRWAARFSDQASQAVPRLVTAFVAQRCSLRLDLCEPLAVLTPLRERFYGLALALGLWRALLEASATDGREVRLEDALSSLVDYLQAPPEDPSHGLRRALHAVVDYAICSQVGGSPPTPTP